MDDLKIAKKMVRTSSSARDRGIPFKISYKKMKQLMTRKTCYYTGVVFDKENPRSIDRVDNDKGYVDSNVVACTIAINGFKSNFTVKEIKGLNSKIQLFLNK